MASALRAACVALTLVVACGTGGGAAEVRLGTTTTIQDSGLLDELVAGFERATGRRVRATVQGTGAILTLARSGSVDVVLVHEPGQERAFVADGFGERRTLVMYNDFVLVGPPADPAGARGKPTLDAFRAIAASRSTFISRGDRSGTDVMERSIWPRAGVTPTAPWYVESGVGQAQSLIVASERRGYMLVDRGTLLSQGSRLELEILVEPEPPLRNLYHAIAVVPAKAPGADPEAARALIEYLTSAAAQELIGSFGRERFGAPLFVPAAGRDANEVR